MTRPFSILDMEQGTPEWFASRLGRLTGSRAKDMLATIKSGEAAARRDYRTELVLERLTGRAQEEGFVSKEMQRGTDLEPVAFGMYEAVTGTIVHRTGFIQHNELMAGCSLDGDVDDLAGIVELKCPKSATHLGYLRTRTVPSAHLAQLTHNLWITGAAWIDFVSFDDRFPPEGQLFIVRLKREDVDLTAYELAARLFLSEVEREAVEVTRLIGAAA